MSDRTLDLAALKSDPGAHFRDARLMRFLSVCSGIEAASVAWNPLGWRAAAFSEIAPFARAVLAHHYPEVPLHDDFTTIRGDEYGAVDLVVGGTPCQDFSAMGLRAGLAGARGKLTIEYVRLLERARPRWFVWENVPGCLTADGGRAFGVFLGALDVLGYSVAWRVLDGRGFGVPQRRARVLVVGYLGEWAAPAAVLLEPESGRRDSTPRGLHDADGAIGFDYKRSGKDALFETAPTIRTIAHHLSHANAGSHVAVSLPDCERAITPLEQERAFGFPDNYTRVPYRGKPVPMDGPRFHALGNSMVVPKMRWVGERIAAADLYLAEVAS